MADERDDFTQITNVKERRKRMIEYFIDKIAKPYNQYITKHNIDILKAFLIPLFNSSLLGYEYLPDFLNQTGIEKERSVNMVFNIQKKFNDVELTDEELDIVSRFALAMRLTKNGTLDEISQLIEKYLTPHFFILSSTRKLTYILWTNANVVKAIVHYKLLPQRTSCKTQIICIPPALIGRKIWLWSLVNRDDRYFLPSIGSYWLYEKIPHSGVLNNPVMLLPEWIYNL